MNKNSRIYVAGHKGMVGSAIYRQLIKQGYNNIITRDRSQLDLVDMIQVKEFFDSYAPEYVYLCAAKVGGILANRDYPADFIYQNLQIQNNVIHQSYLSGVKKLLFLGSTCIYPKFAPQPMEEKDLLTGILEPTNEPYAIAKIAGIKLCQSYNRQYGTQFIACMPTNLYGPNDNFDLETSHVLPAIIAKMHFAKVNNEQSITLWGDGSALREFLYVDDLAEACLHIMDNFAPTSAQNETGEIFMNVGTGIDLSIKELATEIQNIVGYTGKIVRDTSKPNGTPRKVTSQKKLKQLGRSYKTTLKKGILQTYQYYLKQNNGQ